MRINLFLMIIMVPLIHVSITAQSKKVMTPDTYLEWNRIRSESISNNGDWVKYHLSPEKGDQTLKIYNTRAETTYTFDRVKRSQFDYNSEYVIFTMGLAYADERMMKRKHKKDEEYPLDTLCIYHLADRVLTKVPNVNSFALPDKWGDYIIYHKGKETKADSLTKWPAETDESGSKLVVMNLANQTADTLYYASEYKIANENNGLVAHSHGADSLMGAGVYQYDFDGRKWNNIYVSEGKISNIVWHDDASRLAFIADSDTTDTKVRPYELYLWQSGIDNAELVVDNQKSIAIDNYNISHYSTPQFSDDGKRLIFSVVPEPILQDTSLLDDEIVNVEVWHYQDTKLYTRQEVNLKNDKRKGYRCVYQSDDGAVRLLQDESIDRLLLDEDINHPYAIGIVTEPYEKYAMWEGHTFFDGYRIDMATGQRTQFITKERGRVERSPSGKYLMWYNGTKKAHYAYNVETNVIKEITSESIGIFYDELNDRPMDPWPYGDAGYTNDEDFVLMYDRYDIWKIDPDGDEEPQRLTNGREKTTVYRIIDFDREESIIDISGGPLVLHSFNEVDKSEGYEYLDLKYNSTRAIHHGDFKLDRRPMKAMNANDYIFTEESYAQFPDLRFTKMLYDDNMKLEQQRISNANPQQSQYGWGEIKLHSWTSLKGLALQGLLVLPPDFDESKKYPLIVNFYERNSDRLHNHRAPFAHRSTINYSYYSSKGYVIFNPDIIYENGYPGQSCYDAVIPGVASIVALGFIDEDRIGVQGHSWGGYQIADLLTKTDIFRCAESGAPVVNMVSAYGGIRWRSGRSRMFQYEKTQSRLGGTLWETPELYLENSPVFNLDKVTTPVLILHNDKDGAVPWYQGIEYFNGLRRLGKPAWLLNYNGEPHWPVKWQNKLDFNIRMEQFFDHYLMGKPAPRWMKRGVPAIEKGIRQGLEVD